MYFKKFIMTSLFLAYTSCASLPFSGDSKNSEELQTEEQSQEDENNLSTESALKIFSSNSLSSEQIELKQARLWARIDELESSILIHKEKLLLLEKSLMLGIPPQNLTTHTKKLSSFKAKESKIPKKTNYIQELKKGKHLYNNGQYSQAYLIFSKINEQKHNNMNDGAPLFWIAMTWLAIKDYEEARKHFLSYLDLFHDKALVPKAKYHLAKTEYAMTLNESATKRIVNLLNDHPNTPSAESAKKLLSLLKKTL